MDRDAVRVGAEPRIMAAVSALAWIGALATLFLWRKRFGFSDDELKLLLVAVRQMRRTFAKARKTDAGAGSLRVLI